MSKKSFHISDVLTISTGALLSTRHLNGLHDIMSHITGSDDISTIGVATQASAARMFMEQEMPWVKEVEFPKLDKNMPDHEKLEFIDHFLKKAADKYGEYHEVGQMSAKPDVSREADIGFTVTTKLKANKSKPPSMG